MILASFMVPIPALIVNHFVIIAGVKLLNTLSGIILPQLIAPVTVIVYKQFFDSHPARLPRGGGDGRRQRIPAAVPHLPADELGRHDRACDHHLHRRLEHVPVAVPRRAEREHDDVTVGITQVQDAFGVYYARVLAGAVLAGLPVAIAYLIFQRRVTQAITLSAGIKG